MEEMRKKERAREREGGRERGEERGGIEETGNLRSPSDCRNVEHLYVYKLYVSRSVGLIFRLA